MFKCTRVTREQSLSLPKVSLVGGTEERKRSNAKEEERKIMKMLQTKHQMQKGKKRKKENLATKFRCLIHEIHSRKLCVAFSPALLELG